MLEQPITQLGAGYLTPTDLQQRIEQQQTLAGGSMGKFISARKLLEGGSDKMATLLDPILPKTGLVALVGSSDTGKSSFLRQLALAVALGDSSFVGLPLSTTHRRAVYVSTEDDQHSVSFLTRKQIRGRINAKEDYERLLYLFESESLLEELDELLTIYPADLIVLDAYSDLFDGRINDSQSVRTFLKGYRDLTVKHKCLVVFLHHTGKYRDELAPSKHHVVGSQAFEAKMRVVVELRVDPLYHELRHLCIVKGNYLSHSEKSESYVLSFDNDLVFQETGERQSLETLAKPPPTASGADQERTSGYTPEKYQTAVAMRDEGKTLTEIAEELGYAGKSAVSKLFKKFDSNLSQP